MPQQKIGSNELEFSSGIFSITGAVSVSAGSNTAPGFTTAGDTNTGMFFPAADTIAFSEGGVESMRINSSGQVGIGTVSPSVKLQINGASINSALRLNETTSNRNTYLGFIDTSGNFGFDVNDGGYLRFAVNGAERMRITNAGLIGIGTSSPTSVLTIDTGTTEIRSGNALMIRPAGNANDNRLVALSTAGLDVVWGGAPTTSIMHWANGGNVGIGTASPAQRLHVSGGIARIDRVGGPSSLTLGGAPTDNWESEVIFFSSNATRNWRIASNRIISGGLTFTPSTATGGNEYTTPAMVITAAGDVGIGITSPSAKLQVNPAYVSNTTRQFVISDTTGTSLSFGGTDGGVKWINSENTGGGGAYPLAFQTGGTERMRISATGDVSVTQTPGRFTCDVTGGATSIANGGTVDFSNASGMLVVNNHLNGNICIYLCGGGTVTAVSSAGAVVGTFVYNAGVGGYRWTNNSGSTATFGFFFVRTRTTA